MNLVYTPGNKQLQQLEPYSTVPAILQGELICLHMSASKICAAKLYFH